MFTPSTICGLALLVVVGGAGPLATNGLTVTDPASGISVAAQRGGRTLVAKDAKGKEVWKADLSKGLGISANSVLRIRRLSLDADWEVLVDLGNDSWAAFRLKDGELLGLCAGG
jgi:hypothetical protein